MNHRLPFLILVLLASLSSKSLAAEESSAEVSEPAWSFLFPDYVVGQSGSYSGYAALGAGYSLGTHAAWELNYGFTPESIGGRDIHSFSARIQRTLFKIGPRAAWELKPYLGLALVYGTDPELFVLLPAHYPAWYYPPTALRPGIYGGLELFLKAKHALFAEFMVLDSEIPYIKDKGSIDPKSVGSLGLGVRWML